MKELKKEKEAIILQDYSHPGCVIVLYILIFKFSTPTKKIEGSVPNGSKHHQNSIST
jgi:hypothetical protein